MDAKAKELQQELFTEFSPAQRKHERFPSLAKAQKPILVTTNVEQLLLVGIVSILILCGIFFLGVLRGKAISTKDVGVRIAPATIENTKAESGPIQAQQPIPRAIQQLPAKPLITTNQPVRSELPLPNLSADTSKTYTIQLVTHRKKELAEAEVKSIKSAGFYSFIIPSGEYFQVCAGQYSSKDEAKKDMGRFLKKYKDCFLRHK